MLFYLVFFSSHYGRNHYERSLNLIPFKTIIGFLIHNNSFKLIEINILGNILAFGPMGFLLPIVFTKAEKFRSTFILCITATVFIETTQYIFAVGATDVDDIILNVIGGILGYIFFRRLYIFMER